MVAAKVYFVLYIVLLCELFMVIQDRDNSQDAWSNQFKEHIKEYELDFAGLEDSSSITAFEKGQINKDFYLAGMVSDNEKENVKFKFYIFESGSDKNNKVIDSLVVDSKQKSLTSNNSSFTINKIAPALYQLTGNITTNSLTCGVLFQTKRELPPYLPEDVKVILDADIKNEVNLRGSLEAYNIFRPMIDMTIAESRMHYITIQNKNYDPNVADEIETIGKNKKDEKK